MKKYNSESLILRIFMFFLFLFIGPAVIVCAVIGIHSGNVLKNIAADEMTGTLATVLDMADNAFYDVEKIAMKLTYNEKLKNATDIKTGTTMNEKDIRSIQEAYEVLSNLADSNNNIESILVYNAESGQVLSSDRRAENISFYEDTEWYRQYRNNSDMLLWIKDNEKFSENGINVKKEVIDAIYPVSEGSALNGAVIISISIDRWKSLVLNGSNLYVILPRDNSIIPLKEQAFNITEEQKTELTKLIHNTSKRKGTVFERINNERSAITYNTSNYNNLCFVMVNSQNSDFQYIEKFAKFLIILGLAAIILGFMISYLLSKKVYDPIKKITDDIKQRVLADSSFKNEWKYIESAIEKLVEQDNEIKKIKNEENVRERKNLIRSIIYDEADNLEYYQDVFIYPYYAVLIVETDEREKFVASYPYKERTYMMELALGAAKNSINSQSGFAADGFTESNSFIVLINTQNRSFKDMNELFSLIKAQAEKIIGTSVSIAVGDIALSDCISKSFEEARYAFEDKFFYGNGSIIFYESKDEGFDDVNIEYSIITNNIKLANREQVYAYIDKIIEELKKTKNADYARQKMMLMIVMLMNFAKENSIPLSDSYNGQSVLGEFMKCETIKTARECIVSICEQMIQNFEIMLDKNNYKNKIMNYVYEHFRTDIDVYGMARELGISYSQLRRLFMEYTGENIIVYTNRLRIEYAKKMLTETNKTILEIAKETGYNSDQSLNRNFKKFEGISPGEYRKRQLAFKEENRDEN